MKINEICLKITDGSHNPPQGIEQSDYLMLSSKNICDDLITFEEPRYLSEQDFEKEDKRTQIQQGDVLLTIVGTVGRTAVVPTNVPKIVLQRSVAVLHPNFELCNSRFLMYALRGNRSYIEKKAKGVAQKGIYLGDVSNIDIVMFSMEKQIEIVKKLDTLQSIITHRRTQLEKLDELIKARFVEMFGDLADPHCKWKVLKLVDACCSPDDIKCGPFGTQLNKEEYVDTGVAVWEIPQINSAFKTKPTHFVTHEKAKQLIAYSLISGDIAMSRKGNVGKCALFPLDYPNGIIHSDVLRIRVDNERINSMFLMCQLHYSSAVTNQIELVSSGAIMAGINVTKLKQILIHVPPLELQNHFADFVTQIDKSQFAELIYFSL